MFLADGRPGIQNKKLKSSNEENPTQDEAEEDSEKIDSSKRKEDEGK